jgi:hypothetical protein
MISRYTSQKVGREICDRCGDRKPKEVIDGGKKLNVVAYLLFSVLTCGLGLFAFPVFMRRVYDAECGRCGHTFPITR